MMPDPRLHLTDHPRCQSCGLDTPISKSADEHLCGVCRGMLDRAATAAAAAILDRALSFALGRIDAW